MQQYHLIDPPDPETVEAAVETLLSAAEQLRQILHHHHGRLQRRLCSAYFRPHTSLGAAHRAAISIITARMPDQEINHSDGRDYLHRWYLRRSATAGNVYLHQILGSDDRDDGLHDHPWDNVSWVLTGRYSEFWVGGDDDYVWVENAAHTIVGPGDIVWRRAETRHLLKLPRLDDTVVYLVITAPKTRDWGFWPYGVFVPFHDRDDTRSSQTTGTSPSAPRPAYP